MSFEPEEEVIEVQHVESAEQPEQAPEKVLVHPDVLAEIKRRRDHFDHLGWGQADLDRLAEQMMPGEYVGTIGAEACSVHNPFKESPRWISRYPLPEPPPEAPEPTPTKHLCFELRRCSECGHLHKIVLGVPL